MKLIVLLLLLIPAEVLADIIDIKQMFGMDCKEIVGFPCLDCKSFLCTHKDFACYINYDEPDNIKCWQSKTVKQREPAEYEALMNRCEKWKDDE